METENQINQQQHPQRAHTINPDNLECMTVAELLAQWPAVIPVFLKHRMSCVGCNMARFENLADAAHIYGLNFDEFLGELRARI